MSAAPAAPSSRRHGPWGIVVRIAVAVLFVVYPFLVYLALTRFGGRITAALLLGVLVLWGARARLLGRQGFRGILLQAGGVAALSLGTLASDDPVWLQQVPVLISVFLLATFLASLFRPPPMIERYARLVQPELTEGEARHCRIVTWAWVAFFVANAAVAEALVVWGSMEAWAVYAGGIAYGLMGLMFMVEYVVRKARFGRFGNGLHDRVLARLLGRRSAQGVDPGRSP